MREIEKPISGLYYSNLKLLLHHHHPYDSSVDYYDDDSVADALVRTCDDNIVAQLRLAEW